MESAGNLNVFPILSRLRQYIRLANAPGEHYLSHFIMTRKIPSKYIVMDSTSHLSNISFPRPRNGIPFTVRNAPHPETVHLSICSTYHLYAVKIDDGSSDPWVVSVKV